MSRPYRQKNGVGVIIILVSRQINQEQLNALSGVTHLTCNTFANDDAFIYLSDKQIIRRYETVSVYKATLIKNSMMTLEYKTDNSFS